MVYQIEHRIHSLIDNSIHGGFCIEEISFSQWSSFPNQDESEKFFWLASGQEDGKNYEIAFKKFRRKLSRILPRIALIGQAYIEFASQPFLIFKENSLQAYFKHIRDEDPVPLDFQESDLKALQVLIKTSKFSDEFFYYWNDAVNTSQYSSKLLAMFSAIELLFKPGGKQDWRKLDQILGKRLKRKLWGVKGKSRTALRHRLIHGDYFLKSDLKVDYIDRIHKKIIKYFNRVLCRKPLLNCNVISPQRHFFGNKSFWEGFIEAKRASDLNLKTVLKDFEKNSNGNSKKFKTVYDENLPKKF